jgi:hypothetical protein
MDLSAIHSIASLLSKMDSESEDQQPRKPKNSGIIAGSKDIYRPSYNESDPLKMIRVKSKPKKQY